MKQYAVTGMACAACSARVEKAVSRVEGVSSCSVNLLTNSMGVEGDVPDSVIIQAVVDAGYGAHVMEQKKNGETETEDTLKDTETKKLRKRLIASLILLVFLMYLSMGHMMWGWPLPGVLGVNHVAMGLAQMLLTIAIMVINQRFFVSGYKSLWRRSPNMDTLVALGARHGILFKTAAALEETGKIATVALDKTGTITRGEPKVTDMIPFSGYSENELLSYAYALEKKSEHPLARAIVSYAEELDTLAPELSEFEIMPGNGLKGQIKENGKTEVLLGGNQSAIEKVTVIDDTVKGQANRLAEEGKTPLYFAKDDTLLGMIAVADTMKEDSADAVSQMQKMGLRVVMLTGDNEKTANAIGREAGVDEVIAGVLPDEKEAVIRKLKENGKVAMVGDGINDAPALTQADIGIAIGAGTDVAMDAADVVLMKSKLSDVPAAIRLSRATRKNIRENLFWAFVYNIIGIPLAAGVWIPLFGWQLNPMFGAAAMSLSSFCVVTNALRLNFKKI